MKKNNRGSFIEIGKISLFDEKKKRNEIKVRDSLLTIIANYLNQGKSIQDGERSKKIFVEGIVSMYIYIYIIILYVRKIYTCCYPQIINHYLSETWLVTAV